MYFHTSMVFMHLVLSPDHSLLNPLPLIPLAYHAHYLRVRTSLFPSLKVLLVSVGARQKQ
jgi:hypothetical protein